MFLRNQTSEIKRIGFYQTVKKPKTWHRYADILIPLITLPLIFLIALHLYNLGEEENVHSESHSWHVLMLGSALLLISLLVFIYICIRLRVLLEGRSRLRLPLIRSNQSNACFLKSVNSDLQYVTNCNGSKRYTYDSIVYDFPHITKPGNHINFAKNQSVPGHIMRI